MTNLGRGRNPPASVLTISRRHPIMPRRTRLIKRRLSGMFYTLGFLACFAALAHVGYDFFMRTPYFQLDLDKTQITGISEPLRSEISELIKDTLQEKSNILLLNSTGLSRMLEKHPRLKDL